VAILGAALQVQAEMQLKIKKEIVTNQLGFEKDSEFDNWKTKKGLLSRSDIHKKQGMYSLLWKWKKSDELLIDNLKGLSKAADYYKGGQPEIYEPAYYKKGLYGGVKMWLYQEDAQDGEMVFQIGSDQTTAKSNPKFRFEVNLNFTGWRAVWVQFNEDALVENYKGSDVMKSVVAFPSKQLKKGSLFIDHLHLLDFVSYKRHSDLIVENNKRRVRMDSYEILKPYKKYLESNVEALLSQKEIEEFRVIEKKLEFLILGDGSNLWKKRKSGVEKSIAKGVKLANATYDKLNITKNGKYLNGKPLFSSRDEHGTPNGITYQNVIQNTLFSMSFDYRLNGNNESKEKVLTLFDYLADQGWTAGSATGTVDHVIRVNGYAIAAFLMRGELSEEQRAAHQECLAWHTRIGSIIDVDKSIGENTDLVRGGAFPKLISILMMPDSPKKSGLMKEFKTYLEYITSYAPGYSDTFKPDGSVFHHRGTYLNSYGISTVNTVATMKWLMDGTSYAMNEENADLLRKALYRQVEIAYGIDLHMGVCGRFPYKNTAIDRFLLPAYAFMAADNMQVKDTAIAKVFNYLNRLSKPEKLNAILLPQLTYGGTLGTLNLLEAVHQQMGDDEIGPNDGNYSLPFSSFSVHRRGDWLASVKGYDKYVWDYETGHKRENDLGRYLSHGTMFLFRNGEEGGMKGAGMDQNGGFQWAYLPGATTKALPIEKVYFQNTPTQKYLEGYHRSFTESTFARGLSAEGKNGVFAMELRDDVYPDDERILFDSTFRARKSYFFFEDEIVCLGSNISNDDKRYHTITTLFQNNVGKNGIQDKNTLVNGESIGKALDIRKELNGGVFTDVQGIQYVVPAKYPLVLEQSVQKSIKKTGGKKYVPISAPHVKAWLDHGSSPEAGSYEYLILMDGSTKEALQRVEKPAYEVLQKDATAHIVKHDVLNMTGYAVFDPAKFANKGLIANVDTPVMLMMKEDGANAVLTVANPDLQLPKWNHNMSMMPSKIMQGDAKAAIVKLTVNGTWKPAKYVYELMSVEYLEGKTVLSIYTRDGKSIDLPLRKQ